MLLSHNNDVFRNSSINCTQVLQSVEQSCINYLEANNISIGNMRHTRTQEQIFWKPSAIMEFKLNTDGASSVNTRMAGIEEGSNLYSYNQYWLCFECISETMGYDG